jgi:hypothetical protein
MKELTENGVSMMSKEETAGQRRRGVVFVGLMGRAVELTRCNQSDKQDQSDGNDVATTMG